MILILQPLKITCHQQNIEFDDFHFLKNLIFILLFFLKYLTHEIKKKKMKFGNFFSLHSFCSKIKFK